MSKNKSLIIFGNGGLSSVVRYYCENAGIKVSGFTIDGNFLNGNTFEGLPNIDFSKLSKRFSPEDHMLFIAIGASDLLGYSRQKKMRDGSSMGYELFSSAFLNSNLKEKISLGENSLIMPGCNVDPFVKFGDGVIAWNGSTICHHTTIGDYSFIAPGATICGRVTVCEHCFIGSNATIRDNLKISNQSLVGAGAFIDSDTEPHSVYMPAKSAKIDKNSKEFRFN